MKTEATLKTLEQSIWILDGNKRDREEPTLEQILAGKFSEMLKDTHSQIGERQWIPSRINKNKPHSATPHREHQKKGGKIQKPLENKTNHLQGNSHFKAEGLLLNSKNGCHKPVPSMCQEKLSVSVKFYIQRKYLSKMRANYRHFQTTQTEHLSPADFTEGSFKIYTAGRNYMIPHGRSGIQERMANKKISKYTKKALPV